MTDIQKHAAGQPFPGDDLPGINNYLSQFITSKRYQRFRDVVLNRTRHLTVVLEDIFQPHNASAVLRTCDCFGIQDVHIIENRNTYRVNPDVALGAFQWLSVTKYNGTDDNSERCLSLLKKNGYQIIATTPHRNNFSPESLPLGKKTALLFGTELEGLSDTALALADGYLCIPMVGFTESLNISVSAATVLYNLTTRLRQEVPQWRLTPTEMDEVLYGWLCNSVNQSGKIVDHYQRRFNAESEIVP
jgi:tRNA (guanosine-2'-O-)-methyltransferase